MVTRKNGGRARAALSACGRTLCCSLGALAVGLGCNSLDAPIPAPTGMRLVIPTDTRAAVRATKAPVPVSGGTLLVTRSGLLAVASDSDRDSVVVADLAAGTFQRVALNPGDEPGRLVEDAAGRVHVALRRGGAVVTIDPTTLSVLYRRPVCAAPRGLTVTSSDLLQVVCADGKLVTLPTGGGDATRVVSLDVDLRDVVETPEGLTVTRFKSAEILRVDASGVVSRRDHLPEVSGTRQIPDKTAVAQNDPAFGPALIEVTQPFRPLVAWRTIAGPNDSTIVLHQRAVDAEVAITPPSMSGGAYGSGGMSCGGISQDAVSVVGSDGSVSNITFAGPPLAVNAVLLPDGRLVVVHAGPEDTTTPRAFVEEAGIEGENQTQGGVVGGAPFGIGSSVTVLQLNGVYPPGGGPPAAGVVVPGACTSSFQLGGVDISDPAVAVAVIPNHPSQIVVQTVQPSTLVLVNVDNPSSKRVISFDDGTTLDTGFQLFHRASSAGIACASCHPEGAEDGNVWTFESFGPRRTQSLSAGLQGTAPFHWDGTLPGVGSVMDEVFVGRMGGVHENDSRLAIFQNWLFGLKAPIPMRAADDPAVVRGSAVFSAAGCKSCHSGSHFTNNETLSVGTHSAVALQVPSLIGVGYRAPFLHDGCAATLLDRFNPACGGGDLHGATSQLGPADLGDLVSYLESL